LALQQPSIRVEIQSYSLSEGQPILCLRDNEPVYALFKIDQIPRRILLDSEGIRKSSGGMDNERNSR
jgi:hypothetical protein